MKKKTTKRSLPKQFVIKARFKVQDAYIITGYIKGTSYPKLFTAVFYAKDELPTYINYNYG